MEVEERQGHRARRGDLLEGLAGAGGEAGAQRSLAGEERGQAALQGGQVERAGEVQRGGDGVGSAGGEELVEEPQALLGEREREGIGGRCRAQGRPS